MTKAELIEGLANKLNLNKAEAEKAVNILLDDIVGALKQGERVNISGFGTFSVSTRASRVGRNPKTGESIQISASRSAKFRAGKQLKDSLNESAAGGGPQASVPGAQGA
jgi:DNA-binding protein HU-beta